MRRADPSLVTASVLLLVGTIGLRALRWRYILHEPGVRAWHAFGSLNVGYMINNVIPVQVGDVGRSYLLSELAGISAFRTLSTVVIERVMDVSTLLLFLVLLTLVIEVPEEVRAPSITLAAGSSLALAGLTLASARPATALGLLAKALAVCPASWRPTLLDAGGRALDGLHVLTQPHKALALLAASAAVWLSVGLVVYTGMRAFHLDLGYEAAVFLVIATTFGFFIPAAPGGLGVYHGIVIAVLTGVFDVDKNAAVGFALVIHLVFYLPPMVIAPFFLWIERGVWREGGLGAKLRLLRRASAPEASP